MMVNVEVIAAGIILNEDKNKVLLIQRHDNLWHGAWCIPGGHVEFQESINEALVRELMEELNLKIVDSDFLSYEEIMKPNKHMISFNFVVVAKDEIEINHEIKEAKWFPLEELENLNHQIPDDAIEFFQDLM